MDQFFIYTYPPIIVIEKLHYSNSLSKVEKITYEIDITAKEDIKDMLGSRKLRYIKKKHFYKLYLRVFENFFKTKLYFWKVLLTLENFWECKAGLR